MTQINQLIDVNGSDDKPFPQERNFVMNPDAYQDHVGVGHTDMPSTDYPDVRLGQIKYAKRAGAESIYKDASRNTANDDLASAKTESDPSCYNDTEESIGI